MKKILSFCFVFFIIFNMIPLSVCAEEVVTVLVNGEKLESDVPPQKFSVFTQDGEYLGDRIMLPLRAISEKLNCDVYWDEETEGITLYRKNTLTIMWLKTEAAFFMDGLGLYDYYQMDVVPTLYQDRTFIPVRATAELLGTKVDWIDETNTVSITYDLGEIEENTGFAEYCNGYQQLLYEKYNLYLGYFEDNLETVDGTIILEDGREISFSLYPQFAPKTAERFIECAKSGFYNNTIFHRVIKDFMIQGGGFDEKGEEKKSEYFDVINGEFIINDYFNLIPHQRGFLSFARTNDPNSGTTQFFIVQKDSPHLDGYYASFGKVTKGIEIVDEICNAETDSHDKPIKNIMIKTVLIEE